MYDITKRKKFSTVGDLKALLKNIPDETQIVVTGDDYCWFHIEKDGSVICLDVEELDDAYEDEVPSTTNGNHNSNNVEDAFDRYIDDVLFARYGMI